MRERLTQSYGDVCQREIEEERSRSRALSNYSAEDMIENSQCLKIQFKKI